MSTVITSCNCANAFQDTTYGIQLRVFNTTRKSKDPDKVGIRCSSCNAEGLAKTGDVRK